MHRLFRLGAELGFYLGTATAEEDIFSVLSRELANRGFQDVVFYKLEGGGRNLRKNWAYGEQSSALPDYLPVEQNILWDRFPLPGDLTPFNRGETFGWALPVGEERMYGVAILLGPKCLSGEDRETILFLGWLGYRALRQLEAVQGKLSEAGRRFHVLQQISLIINETLDWTQLLQRAIPRALEVLGKRKGVMYLWDEEKNRWEPACYYGLASEEMSMTMTFDGPVRRAGETGSMVFPAGETENYEVALPVKANDRVLGVLVVINGGVLPAVDMELWDAIGHEIGLSIQNARLYKKIKYLADHDDLTGLENRRKFFQTLHREIARANRYGGIFSLILLDLDYFKEFNDKYGHLAGDRVLREIAQAIRKSLRITDVAARYGGDEFAVIALGADHRAARQVAERIRGEIRSLNYRDPLITASAGIACFPRDAGDGEGLVAAADWALYRGKMAGRDRIVEYVTESITFPVDK